MAGVRVGKAGYNLINDFQIWHRKIERLPWWERIDFALYFSHMELIVQYDTVLYDMNYGTIWHDVTWYDITSNYIA